jgi:hypothetical protein
MRLSEVALEKTPHAWLELAVMGFVVALPQARENAKDARVSLRRERPIGPLERFTVTGCGNVAVDHRALDSRRNVPAGVLEHRGEVVGRVAGDRILEIEQPKMAHAFAIAYQHDVLRVVIAEHGDGAEAVVGHRAEHSGPRRSITLDIDVRADRRTVPFGEQFQFLEPLIEGVRAKSLHRGMLVQMDQHVGRQLVQFAFPRRIVIEEFAQAPVAEIAEQQ